MRRLVAALLVVVAATMALAPAAGAQETPTTAPPEATETTAPAEPAEDQQIISGNLRYEDEAGEQVPVEGIEITVESADGSYSESAESDEDGRFEVPVPAAGSYTVAITEDDLPDDVGLRNDRPELPVRVRDGRINTPVLFPLGFGDIGTRDVSTDVDRAARLAVQGIRFGLIIAMCAIGLSLIFGTTRLTNFAHGEIVTFGALVAYFFNATLGWHLIPAAITAIGIATLAGSGFDRFFWRPLRNRGTGLIAMLVISIGVSIFFRYIYNFQFGGQLFYEIRDGKITGMLKDVAYQMRTPDFWNAMDMIGGRSAYEVHGSFYDGKGQPGQVNAVSHGTPPARFRGVNVLNTGRRG